MSKSKPELKLVEDTGSQLQEEDLSIELPPQQSEMPFAVVEGEPVTQLPRDLYIPPDALQVFLTAFEGPLDLLLYLIRKQNLDILNIPIAEITRQYMQYIEVMAEMQLELAGEYLLMAAMLAEIKSRMLLPRPPVAEGHEEEDPRAELVRRLQEYERFKKAAEDLDRLNRLERDNITASAELEERKVVKLLPDVTLKEMLDAFRDVLSRAEKFAHHHISRERLSQRERMTEILARLQTVAFFEFRQLFKPEEGRMGVTVTFIAILELMKEGLIEIVQAEAYAPIHVRTAQRHLKVVQGGVAASETADAENAAALAQPELAGENDIPDEDDDTPPADDAAIAVQEAVADVAAASSIAVDSIESDNAIADAGFVEAAVSEAVASTENAVETVAEASTDENAIETVAEVDAASEGAVSSALAEEVAAGSPVVIDEATIGSPVAEEVTLEDVPHEFGPVDDAGAFVDELEAQVVEHGAVDPLEAQVVEHAAEPVEASVSPIADALPEVAITQTVVTEDTAVDAPEAAETIGSVETSESFQTIESAEPGAAVNEIAAADPTESHPVEEHIVEEHEVEEHIVPEHVVEEHIVPDPTVEENNSLAETHEAIEENPSLAGTYQVADESSSLAETREVAEENPPLAETHEPVEESSSLAETREVAEENASLAETHEVVEQNNSLAETHEVAEENSSLAETHEVADESSSQAETYEGVEEDNSQAEMVRVADETVALAETEVASEFVADAEPVAAGVEETVAQVEPIEPVEVVEQFVAAAETAEIADEPVVSSDLHETHDVEEHAQPVETTDVAVTENTSAAETIDVAVTEDASAVETTVTEDEPAMEVVAETAPALEAIEVVAEDAPSNEPVDVVAEETPTDETIEVAAEDVPSDQTTNVLIEAASTSATAEQDQTNSEQIADLSEDDDSVTGAGSPADNSDAEPSR